MTSQHLSDEAIAAFADGVLTGHAQSRASRHTGECPECAYAVAVQREAVWALRAAPAPSLPTGLLDRLRQVPASTPLQHLAPDALAADGSDAFAAFNSPAAAIVAPQPAETEQRHDTSGHWHGHGHGHGYGYGPIVTTIAAVAAAGVLAVGSAAHVADNAQPQPQPHQNHAAVRPAQPAPQQGPALFAPASWQLHPGR